MKKIEVCVGSSNPTKIQAVKMAFDKNLDKNLLLYKLALINVITFF